VNEKLTYKGRDYNYGFEKVRDYPVRGKTSHTFFIKVKVGVKPFKMTKLVFRSDDVKYKLFSINNKPFEELVIKKIDEHIIISRRRKLKILNNKN